MAVLFVAWLYGHFNSTCKMVATNKHQYSLVNLHGEVLDVWLRVKMMAFPSPPEILSCKSCVLQRPLGIWAGFGNLSLDNSDTNILMQMSLNQGDSDGVEWGGKCLPPGLSWVARLSCSLTPKRMIFNGRGSLWDRAVPIDVRHTNTASLKSFGNMV